MNRKLDSSLPEAPEAARRRGFFPQAPAASGRWGSADAGRWGSTDAGRWGSVLPHSAAGRWG